MPILLLLKHLKSPFKFFVCFTQLSLLGSRLHAVFMFMKFFGILVSASECTSLLFIFVCIWNWLLFDFLISVTLSLVKLVDSMKLTFCQFSILSLMQHVASGSIVSSGSSWTLSSCSIMFLTFLLIRFCYKLVLSLQSV